MKRLVFILFSVVFWVAVLLLAFVAMIVHGDCYAGTTEAEFHACNRAAGMLGIGVIAIGALLYALVVRDYLRNRAR